jgi:hypothetical protein
LLGDWLIVSADLIAFEDSYTNYVGEGPTLRYAVHAAVLS